nr:hypothetical protein [uncultured Solibaculum sp.]
MKSSKFSRTNPRLSKKNRQNVAQITEKHLLLWRKSDIIAMLNFKVVSKGGADHGKV